MSAEPSEASAPTEKTLIMYVPSEKTSWGPYYSLVSSVSGAKQECGEGFPTHLGTITLEQALELKTKFGSATPRTFSEHKITKIVQVWVSGTNAGMDPTSFKQIFEELKIDTTNLVIDSNKYEKAVLVTGDTKQIKEELKKIGGKWNFTLKGWIFSKAGLKKLGKEFPW